MEKKYKYMTEIGQGTYGVVYKAVHKATGRLVAVKKSREQEEDGVPATSIREMTLLRMLSENKHIVRLLGVDFAPSESKPPNPEKPTLCMVFEYMDCTLQGLMDKYRSKKQKMPSKVIKEIMYQLLLGVSFCHRRGVLHRDLKPANLLVNERELLLKLADFGLGRPYSFHQKTYTQEVVTLWYRAPELLLGSPHYSTPVDVWSIGCIFAELAKMHPLFYGKTELEQLLAIFLVLGTPTEDVWHGVTQLKDWVAFPQWKPQDMKLQFPNLDDDGIDLLSGMLLYEPSKRITAKKALSHPYFKDLDKDFVRYHRKSRRARRSNITYSRVA